MSEKNQNENEMVISISAGYTHSTKPHMEFEYPDLNIHKDIYQLMKYSCGEVCTPEQRDKVMKIWTTFLEPLLGIPSCALSVGDKQYVVKANNHSKKNLKDIGHADEVCYSKLAGMSKSGDKRIAAEDSFPSRQRMTCGNNGNVNESSPGANNVAIKCDILCNASSTVAREKQISKESASTTCKEADLANEDCGMEMMPSQQSQDNVIINVTTCSIYMGLEEVKLQKHHEESGTCSKCELEKGELSPNRNLEGNSFVAFKNSDTKTQLTLPKSEPTVGDIKEEEMCVEEAVDETEANGADEVEDTAQVLSDSENGNVSGSESANGEECSPEEPDDDGDHDENNKKAESEEDADCTASTEEAISDHHLQTVKPLRINVPGALIGKEKKSHIFYGNDSFYLLFRLHQMLYERMQTAKLHSSTENKWRISENAKSADSYARFKDALHSLLDGSYDNAKFEDECQALVGTQSYILFTLDKLIHKLVKQLQIIATEEMDNRLFHLYAYERSRSPETFSDALYYENARFLLLDDNVYRIEFSPGTMRLTMQLMENEHIKLDPVAVSIEPYLESYLNDELLSVPVREENYGVFMKRNKKFYSSEDEYSDTCKAMEGLVIHNGVEMKVNCNLKISYVLDTEDFLYRPRKRRRDLYGNGTHKDCPHRAKCCKLMFN